MYRCHYTLTSSTCFPSRFFIIFGRVCLFLCLVSSLSRLTELVSAVTSTLIRHLFSILLARVACVENNVTNFICGHTGDSSVQIMLSARVTLAMMMNQTYVHVVNINVTVFIRCPCCDTWLVPAACMPPCFSFM